MKLYLLCLVCLSLLYVLKSFLCVCVDGDLCVFVQFYTLPWLSIYILYRHISGFYSLEVTGYYISDLRVSSI